MQRSLLLWMSNKAEAKRRRATKGEGHSRGTAVGEHRQATAKKRRLWKTEEKKHRWAVTVGAWAHSPLLKTVEAGWLTGYPDGTVRPNAPLTRTMMAMIIAKALELQPGDAQQVSFADAEDIPAWGKAAVEAARSKGLIRGQASNRFNPDATTTRAEAATLILRLLELE